MPKYLSRIIENTKDPYDVDDDIGVASDIKTKSSLIINK